MFFSYNVRNISWKFEQDCLKNEEEDRFLVIFKFQKNIPQKFAVHMFVSETVYKKKPQKLKNIF